MGDILNSADTGGRWTKKPDSVARMLTRTRKVLAYPSRQDFLDNAAWRAFGLLKKRDPVGARVRKCHDGHC